MLGLLFKKIFGSRNDREVRKLRPLVAKINALHRWHHARVTGAAPGGAPSLDEIDRTLDACRDPRRGSYGRWCGAGAIRPCA